MPGRSLIATVVVAALSTGLATVLGALPVLRLRTIRRRPYDIVLGFGAGMMIAAATVGLLGHALSAKGSALGLGGGFFVGVGLMFLLDRLMPHLHAAGHGSHLHSHDGPADPHAHGGHEHIHDGRDEDAGAPPKDADQAAMHKGLLIAGALILHRIPEGFAIGTGFQVGEGRLGLFLALALALQNVCEGLVLTVPLLRGGFSTRRTLAVVSLTALSTPLAALASVLLLQVLAGSLSTLLPIGLAVAAGALLYLVVAEMLPESHSHGNEVAASLALAVGFGTTLLMHLLVDHH